MTKDDVVGTGTPSDPWQLTTPPGNSEFEAFRDPDATPPALVVQVGKTQLRYHLSAIEDLHTMLVKQGDWVPLGNADEQKDAAPGTVEAWGRLASNPVGGWYGMQEGTPRTFRQLRAAGPRGARACRGRTQPAQQSHARDLRSGVSAGASPPDRGAAGTNGLRSTAPVVSRAPWSSRSAMRRTCCASR